MAKKIFIILFALFMATSFECAQNNKTVQINFDYPKRGGFSSNQIAIWVEDNNGNYIKTIYITDFTGRRAGWKKRNQSLSNWQKKADAIKINQAEIDAVSKANSQIAVPQYSKAGAKDIDIIKNVKVSFNP